MMTEWISVKDELPPREPILVCDDKEMHVAYPRETDEWYTGSGETCYYCGGQSQCDYVKHPYIRWVFTHWSNLPALPNIDNTKYFIDNHIEE